MQDLLIQMRELSFVIDHSLRSERVQPQSLLNLWDVTCELVAYVNDVIEERIAPPFLLQDKTNLRNSLSELEGALGTLQTRVQHLRAAS